MANETRHHVRERRGLRFHAPPHDEMPRGAKSVALTEIGPRFEMKLYQIKLGTIDADDADVEWALRPFMRSGKKRRL